MKIISASIDLTKIDKAREQTVNKDGQPFKNGAKYYNIDIVVKDEKDQYGNDTSVSTSQSKEEREAKAPKVYLGNGKTVWSGESTTNSNTSTPATSNVSVEDNSLPF